MDHGYSAAHWQIFAELGWLSIPFAEAGISLFLVDANAEGVERICYRMTGGREVANIRFNTIAASALLGEPGQGVQAMQPVLDGARLAICAEALGAMEMLNKEPLECLKTRRQFGITIGSFQTLKTARWAALSSVKTPSRCATARSVRQMPTTGMRSAVCWR